MNGSRWLAISACGGAALLVVAAAGLLPAREPAAPERQPFSVQETLPPPNPLTQVLPDAAASDPSSAPARVRPARVAQVGLCDAPERGARWYKVQALSAQSALLVWCKQGYELFGLKPAAPAGAALAPGERIPEVTRLARFKARAELPGGAAAGDFDGDGQLDLVLGVAARPGVVHRSGAGVFWLRGRAQGGYEPARVLAETSSAALAAHETPGATHELLVLTTGDVAAQRPGELWSFTRTPALSRQRVAQVGLDPRGLSLRAGAEAGWLDAWVLSGQPGRIERVALELASHELHPERGANLPMRGAQALAHEPSEHDVLLARDATSIQRVERGAAPQLSPFANGAHVGPFAVSDLDGDLKPDVFSALDDGVAWLSGSDPVLEYTLPPELKPLDVETVRLGAGPVPLALVQGPEPHQLSLLVLPSPPWRVDQVGAVELLPTPVKEAEALANVALE